MRALSQTMYLLEASDRNGSWLFRILGNTGTTAYDIEIGPGMATCSCPDFAIRRTHCKHIYFVVGRVLDERAVLYRLIDEPGLDLFAACPEIQALLNNRLQHRVQVENTPPAWTSQHCIICFEEAQGRPWTCNTCAQSAVHEKCIEVWTERTPSCPLCRSEDIHSDIFHRLVTIRRKRLRRR